MRRSPVLIIVEPLTSTQGDISRVLVARMPANFDVLRFQCASRIDGLRTAAKGCASYAVTEVVRCRLPCQKSIMRNPGPSSGLQGANGDRERKKGSLKHLQRRSSGAAPAMPG
jgi:hypothetical protein